MPCILSIQQEFFGVARCRYVAVLRIYKAFGIMQNHFHTWNQQRQFFYWLGSCDR
ncbi:hypothetical protein [Nostoc sp. UHCC 0251]|uniref:hypothetical protein n=1 Tax=Nostoc sp. UHCC 0251 TaxID=3110240 RepID=UPI002B1FAA0A|nr:hypothetical protein [Nostoc sp. UHCC 0251]MEA5624201.1 hypothetical protein [Nostoc sp. UHCC 0251]